MSLRLPPTFTLMPVPEEGFGVGAEALHVMDGRGSSHGADAPLGEGVGSGQAGGGLVLLRLVQPVPGVFGRGVVQRCCHADLRRVVTGADEGVRVVGIRRAVLGGRGQAGQGQRVLGRFGGVHHDAVRVLLGKRLFAGSHEAESCLAESEESALS